MVAGFGGHFGNMVYQRKIMVDGEAQKLQYLNFFKWFLYEVYGSVFQAVISERPGEDVGFVRVERHIPLQVLDQLLILCKGLQRGKGLLKVCLKDGRCIWQRVE